MTTLHKHFTQYNKYWYNVPYNIENLIALVRNYLSFNLSNHKYIYKNN